MTVPGGSGDVSPISDKLEACHYPTFGPFGWVSGDRRPAQIHEKTFRGAVKRTLDDRGKPNVMLRLSVAFCRLLSRWQHILSNDFERRTHGLRDWSEAGCD
jgi:hypothetical protein